MEAAQARRAVAAATLTVSTLGLEVDDAVVLNDSNRLVVRLTPCDVVARVVPPTSLAPAAARASWLSGVSRSSLARPLSMAKSIWPMPCGASPSGASTVCWPKAAPGWLGHLLKLIL